MDGPTAWVAIVASGGSASVAIYAVHTQLENAKKDREHDVILRRQERRAVAYLELMTALRRLASGVERTAPFFTEGEPPAPPSPFKDEETWHLSALTDVIASDELRELLLAWLQKQSDFYFEVRELRRIQETEERLSRLELPMEEGPTGREQWRKVDATRVELRAELQAIGARVRAEL
jgi:hypothetical protein